MRKVPSISGYDMARALVLVVFVSNYVVVLFYFDIVTNVLISPCIFLLIAYIIWHSPIVFYLKKNRMAWRHAPFAKKNVAPCIADVPFFISSNDP